MEYFLSDVLPTFIAGSLAFLFALYLYILQKKTENGLYLSYAISMLSAQSTSIYSFKKDISEVRNAEVQRLENQFSRVGKEKTHLEISEISKFISNAQNFELPIDLQRLAFIADFDPNILLLFKVCLNASKDLDQMIENCNLEVMRCRDGENNFQDIYMLIQQNKELLDQIDYTLTLVEKLQELLVDFAKIEYKTYVIITGIETLPEYASLKPHRKTSWNELEYSSRKRSCVKKITRMFKKIWNC